MARFVILSLVLGSVLMPMVVARVLPLRRGMKWNAMLSSLMIGLWIGAVCLLAPRLM